MSDGQNWKLAAAVVAGAVSSGCAILGAKNYWPQKKEDKPLPTKWIRVGQVSKLTIYPVKSCKGIDIMDGPVEANILGLKASEYVRDRIFLVAKSDGHYRTLRRLPKMVFVEVKIDGHKLTLSAPEKASITIQFPEKNSSKIQSCKVFEEIFPHTLDCGDLVGEWLSDFLEEKNLRLFYHEGEDRTQRVMTSMDKKFPNFVPTDKGTFQDVTSFMMMAEESVEELNRHLEEPWTMKHFRPSIVINGTPQPFAEDLWTFVKIGETEDAPIFKASQPCTRCKVTTLDPTTGVFATNGEPLRTLKKLKRSVGNKAVDDLMENEAVLGLHLGLFREGRAIQVGQPVYTAVL